MITLPFTSLPGASELFIDYCRNQPDAATYFLGHFADMMAWETHFQFLEQRTVQRDLLADVLHRQNTAFRSGAAAMRNIEAFRADTTFAVVTGQQVGLFTGPLYTVYKAMTAVRLARWLEEQYPAYRFIPVFWLESEDHDLDEANSAGVVNRDNDFVRVSVETDGDPQVKNVRPVGQIVFDQRIEGVVAALLQHLPPTDFTTELRDALAASYVPGATFTLAFAHLFNVLYPDSGLVFIDPSDRDVKQLLAPVFLQELETFPVAGEEVIKRSAELEERYHAQIKPRAVNLFLTHKNGRYAIEPSEEHAFFLRGTRQRHTLEELLELADTAPESFSPNVLLRPVCQDFLFPTAAYVAGPSEVAYFAQLQPVYDHYHVPLPMVFPRASITLVDAKIRKLFDRFQIPYAAMFDSPDDIYRLIAHGEQADEVMRELDGLRSELDALLARLPDLGARVGPNLADPAQSTMANIDRYFALFTDRLVQARKQRDSVLQRQLEKMQVYLAPEGIPQERQVNVLTYFNRYGRAILGTIADSCEPFPAEHRIVNV